jgi:hypothetical protein
MLWFDNNPKTTLISKIIRAVEYYTHKYGRVPNLCLIHPSMLPEKPVEFGGITVRAYRPVLPHHLWLGIEDENG